MFSKHHDTFIDLSLDLHEPQDWKPGVLRTLDYASKVTALAYEPIAGLLAVGTSGSIELLGKPGVACKITLPDLHEVKLLHISPSTFKLLCLDDHDELHIWDLSAYGHPKLLVTTRFDQSKTLYLASSITISPSHSHAFIALQTGEIQTYDLECLRKSSYYMPNMWTLYEEKMAASGMPEIATTTSGIAIDTLIHPRNLNLLFVVYGGGVVLSDLSERTTLRTYELVYPPGAPGGTGYGASDILVHRRPEATCMAIHPSGHLFAVGYADGSIAFWAIEDEDQPLLVRTLNDLDVQNIDAEKLEAHLAHKDKPPISSEKEPIFKLSWCSFSNSSDPRGGETALIILGGLSPEDSPGITVHWFPAFNPTDPPATPSTAPLHPYIRSSMRSSVDALNTYFYNIHGTVHDYLLIPRGSPHFAGSFDAISILIVRESVARTRIVEAYEFPPPSLVHHPDAHHESPDIDDEEERDTLDDLAKTLKDLQMENEPRRLLLPGYLGNGTSGLLGGEIRTVTKDAYSSLVQADASRHALCLKAGLAWSDPVEHISKYQPPRITVVWYADLSVQVWDVSAQLLHKFKPDPVDCDFPNPLPNFTIDTNIVLMAPSVAPKLRTQNHTIQYVKLAPESLECAVVLSSGIIIVYRLVPPPGTLPSFEELPDPELVSLKHISPGADSKFTPYFALLPTRGQVSACAIADVGFLAVAYPDGSLFVIDMRGPTIILRHSIKAKSRHSIGIHMSTEDAVICLEWTISPVDKDERLALRLIAGHESGTFEVFTFERSVNLSWNPTNEVVKFDGPVHPLGVFVLNNKNGIRCPADRSRLASALSDSSNRSSVLLVVAGSKGARCNININGDRIGRVEWSHKMGKVLSVQIVQKLSSYALVAFTENHEACAYSLPNLDFMHNLILPPITYLPISADETGDFFAWTRNPETGLIRQATYGTLFNFRRVETPPEIDFLSTKPVIPAQPQPVSMGPTSILGSWFNFGQSVTGAQIDALLGGVDRPVPKQQPRPPPLDNDHSQIVKQVAATQNTLYDRLTSALNERGQMLGDLEDRFNSLESGSRSMVDQAKKLAAEQSAKSWFKF
ncbi:WD40 containing snare-dependent exocytosis protein [Lentinula detonsa]|uniref:WD40 containing snare-dependent exocytosis protein n=1 Tax=Lentinula detonsa TaxID=2804962 RepID=A0AA38Q7Z8_9AGAR|nr:WD40 containing snare-dependent exocytosis protein [Lentinula detonsa]